MKNSESEPNKIHTENLKSIDLILKTGLDLKI